MGKDNVSERLNVPAKLRVGAQLRKDTYSGVLAYVTYIKGKTETAKKTSWNNWCHHDEWPPKDFDNVPTTGFVVNKQVGGVSGYRSWSDHDRIEKVRIYDPRGWEFEITIPNLLYLLQESSCDPGKGLGAKCIYAWNGPSLVLLPVNSEAYTKSVGHTELQAMSVKAKELVLGHTYETKRHKHLVYLGLFDYRFAIGEGMGTGYWGPRKRKFEKDLAAGKLTGIVTKHVFAERVMVAAPKPASAQDEDDDVEDEEVDEPGTVTHGEWKLHYEDDVKFVARTLIPEVVDNFAALVMLHNRSFRGSAVTKLVLKSVPLDPVMVGYTRARTWYFEQAPGVFAEARGDCEYDRDARSFTGPCNVAQISRLVSATDGLVRVTTANMVAHRPHAPIHHHNRGSQNIPWVEPTLNQLFAVLECGVEVQVNPDQLGKE